MSNQKVQVLEKLIKVVSNHAFTTAESLKDEYKKSGKPDKHLWNNNIVPSLNYVRLAVESVYYSGQSFGDFTKEEVEKLINSQPKWEKSVNFLAQSAALIFPLK